MFKTFLIVSKLCSFIGAFPSFFCGGCHASSLGHSGHSCQAHFMGVLCLVDSERFGAFFGCACAAFAMQLLCGASFLFLVFMLRQKPNPPTWSTGQTKTPATKTATGVTVNQTRFLQDPLTFRAPSSNATQYKTIFWR